MRQSILFRKTYNLVTEDAAESKDGVPDDELLQQGVHFTAKVQYRHFLATAVWCGFSFCKGCFFSPDFVDTSERVFTKL